MDDKSLDLYKEKFKRILEETGNSDVNIPISVDVLKSIIEDPDVFKKFLDFENNYSFFGQENADCLPDFLIALKAYSEFCLDNKGVINPFIKDRMRLFTDFRPLYPSNSKNNNDEEKCELCLELMKDFSYFFEIMSMSEFEDIDPKLNFDGLKLRANLKYNNTFRALIQTGAFGETVKKSLSFFDKAVNLERDDFWPNNTKVQMPLSLDLFLDIHMKDCTPTPESIVDFVNNYIKDFRYDKHLVANWKHIVSYCMKLYGFMPYVKNDETDNSLKCISDNAVSEFEMPKKMEELFVSSLVEDKYQTKLKSSYILPDSATINEELERAIMQNVVLTGNKELDAFNIYNALNKAVVFSSVVYLLESNSSLDEYEKYDFIDERNSKDLSEFNIKNNGVTCHNWSEIYAYLCKKYIDCRALINSDLGHRSVTLFTDENVISADGTMQMFSNYDYTRVDDILRAKMGWKPIGFKTLFPSKEIEAARESFGQFEESSMFIESENYAGKDSVEELLTLVGEENLQDKVLNLGGMSIEEKIIRKISYLNELMKSHNFSEIDVVAFLPIGLRAVLNQDEAKKVRFQAKLATPIDNRMECNILPTIAINIGDKNDKKYLYLIYDKTKGFCNISREAIIGMIKNGDVKVMDSGNAIWGLEYYTNDEAVKKYGFKEEDLVLSSDSVNQGDER